MDEMEIYATIGEEGFTKLVRAFYKRIPTDPIIGPMYPEQDFEGAETRLRQFLVQRFGGPTTYSDERGHPRLRMRHMHFKIDVKARHAWMNNMNAALEEVQLPKEVTDILRTYFSNTATGMMNQ